LRPLGDRTNSLAQPVDVNDVSSKNAAVDVVLRRYG